MAHPFGGGKILGIKVNKLIELFTAMGCELRTMEAQIAGPDGTHPIRFLYSPGADDFVSLLHYDDEDYIPFGEVENWERRLGITVPKGNSH